VEFRHLATDADATASSEDRSELPNRVNDPMARLIENDRVWRGGDALQSEGEEFRETTVSSARFLIA